MKWMVRHLLSRHNHLLVGFTHPVMDHGFNIFRVNTDGYEGEDDQENIGCFHDFFFIVRVLATEYVLSNC